MEIKYRHKDLLKKMHQRDPECRALKVKLGAQNLSPSEKATIEKKMTERELKLISCYHQAAIMFADLQDMPMRMLEKGCIKVSDLVLFEPTGR